MAGVHMIVNFYLKPSVDPKDFGFEEREGFWVVRYGLQRSSIVIDGVTRKIQCNSMSSKCLATLLRIAEAGGVEIEEETDKTQRYRMSLTEEEVRAIEALRGHPEKGEE